MSGHEAPPSCDPEGSRPGGIEAIVRLAAAIAVQDAAAYLRNTQTVANATIGMAQEMLLHGGEPAAPQAAQSAAQEALRGAIEHFSSVGVAATKLIERFQNRSE